MLFRYSRPRSLDEARVLAHTPIYVWCVMQHYYLLAIMQSNWVAGWQISRSSDGDSAIEHDIRFNDVREEKGRMRSIAHIVAPVCGLHRVRNSQILIDTREIRRTECCTSACPGSCFLQPKDTRNLPRIRSRGKSMTSASSDDSKSLVFRWLFFSLKIPLPDKVKFTIWL